MSGKHRTKTQNVSPLVKALQQKAVTNQGRGRRRIVRERAGPTSRNDYLASLLDPINNTGVGIPDFDTYPSAKVHTSKRIRVTTDASGNWVLLFRPNVYRGVFYPGIDGATGNYHCVQSRTAGSVAPASPAGTTFASVEGVMTATDLAFFATNYSSVRPVSACLKTENIAAALTITGDLFTTTLPAESLPFPASYSTLAATGIETAVALPNPTYLSPADIMSGVGQLESVTRETITTWKPEGPESYIYSSQPADTTAVAVTDGASTGFFSNEWWVAGSTNTPALQDVKYYLPERYDAAFSTGVFQALTPSVANGAIKNIREPNNKLPFILLKLEGCPPSTVVMELEIIINWECIPRNSVTALMPTTPSYAVPDELAQATNVMQMIPATHYPGSDSNMRANQLRASALQSTSHLYEPTVARKEAVTGQSMWTRFRRGAASVLSRLAAPLALIPKAGPLLSGGAALIGNLLGR